MKSVFYCENTTGNWLYIGFYILVPDCFMPDLLSTDETDCPFRKLSEEEILNDLEISRRQIAAGETKEMGQAIEGIRKKYGL